MLRTGGQEEFHLARDHRTKGPALPWKRRTVLSQEGRSQKEGRKAYAGTARVPRTLQLPFLVSLSVPALDTSVGPRSSLPEKVLQDSKCQESASSHSGTDNTNRVRWPMASSPPQEGGWVELMASSEHTLLLPLNPGICLRITHQGFVNS